jgi:hypothetical protein
LGVGTPEEVVAARALRVFELELDDAVAAADLLRKSPEVDEVMHLGHLLRVATRGVADAGSWVETQLRNAGMPVRAAREVRPTVEDAFVSTVRAESETGARA